jgi:ubiquinone/menaquinone biosynthesis C-methylase UbiE
MQMKIAHVSKYTAVDSAADPAALAACMDLVALCGGVDHGRRLVGERLALRPGTALLDLGCGTGDQTRELAAQVVPGGRAVGLDLSRTMIDEARRRSEAADLPVQFEVGDAQCLPFADGTFDACRTERMLIHVPDAPAALAEMVRVTRPGGRVGVIDAEVETVIFDSADRELTRRIVTAFADSFQNGWIGRRLPRMMAEAGLTALTVEPYVMTFHPDVIAAVVDPHLAVMMAGDMLTAEEAGRWRAEVLDDAVAEVAMTMATVVGVKG